ncbi:hypothetical protein, partial, partial [Absidia glauca]
QETDLILWDEAVMSSKYNFEAVDRCLKDMMGAVDPTLKTKLFGGKVVVFGGDFRQIIPVVVKGSRADVIAECVSSSDIWSQVQVPQLTENMSVRYAGQEAAALAQKLLAIGDGSNGFKSAVPIEREWLLASDDLPSLIDKVYPSFATETNPISFDGRAILASKNDQVDAINDKAAAIFPGESQVYESC